MTKVIRFLFVSMSECKHAPSPKIKTPSASSVGSREEARYILPLNSKIYTPLNTQSP